MDPKLIEQLSITQDAISDRTSDKLEALQIVREHDVDSLWNILGVGVSRIGIATGANEVVKIAYKHRGLADSLTEYKLWKYIEKDNPFIDLEGDQSTISYNPGQETKIFLRDLLAPVLDYNEANSLIVLERCLPVNFQSGDPKMKEIVKNLSRFGISDAAVNLGFLEARTVCFDYAWLSADLFSKLENI